MFVFVCLFFLSCSTSSLLHMLCRHKRTAFFFFSLCPAIMMYVNLFFLLVSSLLLSRSCRGGWERTPRGGKVGGQMVTDRRASLDGNEENRRFMCDEAADPFHSSHCFCLFIFFPLMVRNSKGKKIMLE